MTTFLEYIWIDGSKPTQTLRSKTKVMEHFRPVFRENGEISSSTVLPEWGFDGSSTGQATGEKSDCVLFPVSIFKDPIRKGGNHYLVMCEVLRADKTPHPSNHRAVLRDMVSKNPSMLECWFGLEQEYTLFKGSRPLGFGEDRRFPAAQGPYYCGVGADEVFGRELIEEHMLACVEAGIKISGINAEVMPGQWEFQIGPLDPIKVGDHLWIARWLLYRLGEKYGIHATLDPKPVPGDWNGAGCHSNFSTPEMRASNLEAIYGEITTGKKHGMEAIEEWCERAGQHIKEHLAAYGEGIEMRLTGRHETCRYDQYKWGVSDRTASIRIPLMAKIEGKGYLEDRRPNANACPYRVATVMLKTAYDLW
jgi:glutamine synthetase